MNRYGELPKPKQSLPEQYKKCIELAEHGDLTTIKTEFPGIYLRYVNTFKSLRRRESIILPVLTNEWWVGPTGTGKSRNLWSLYPDHFSKPLNKWWDGYDDQDVVALEEWSPSNECTASQLKIWADRYPFNAQIKGGTLLKIRPKKIIVLSNYTIEECFPNVQDQLPIKRRFKVKKFTNFFPNCLCDPLPTLDDIDPDIIYPTGINKDLL